MDPVLNAPEHSKLTLTGIPCTLLHLGILLDVEDIPPDSMSCQLYMIMDHCGYVLHAVNLTSFISHMYEPLHEGVLSAHVA